MAGKFYAVKKGRKPGIYMSWDACKAQVMGFPNARYKGFKTKAEAEAFLNPDANELMQIDEDTLVAYVDGSYDHSQKRFSYGMVLMHDGVERYFAYPYADKELTTMRNVAGEIKGSEAAMRFAKENGYKKLAIHYDYEGIQKWCTGEWAAKKEGTQDYQRIYEEMKQYVQIKFVKVKGHSNDKYNDYADMLAKSALGIGDGSFEKKEDQEWIKVTACRPVVVGAKIQVILPILFNLAVRIHRDDLVAHLLRHKVDIFPLAACNALIFFRQIKFDGGRCNQIVHLYPIQLLGIGADDPRILFRQRLTGAENLHPHIAVQKQAAHLLACGSLLAQAVSRCIRVAVSVIVNCRGLRLFCQLLLWLLLSFRLRLRQLLALLSISSCRMDANIIRVNTLHLFQLRCQRHQLLPLRKAGHPVHDRRVGVSCHRRGYL